MADYETLGPGGHERLAGAILGAVKPLVQPPEITVTAGGSVTQELAAGTLYHFTGALTSLTVTLRAAAGTPHYHFDFLSGAPAPALHLPAEVRMPDDFSVTAGRRYEVDILHGCGAVASWTLS